MQLTDAAQSPLKGGTFRLARPATETDRVEDTLYLDGKKTQVVFVPFFATADMSEAPVTTLTTDDEGRALAFGLPYGTYFLVQTAAPLGYQILTTPIPVTVNAASHLTKADGWENRNEETVDNTVVIVNTPFALPETGSRGRILLTLLTAIALGLTLLNYRKLPITETQA